MSGGIGASSWDPDLEELRIALVMNGGVSLAVWIGGLTQEINRLVRAEGPYGQILELLHTRAQVDVISGTSAGGINGALLSVALTRGSQLDQLRDLWVDRGSFRALLRHPLDPSPISLLRGDDYLRNELRIALEGLAAGGRSTSPDVVPLRLFLTATMLNGEAVELADDFGTAISDVRHKAVFTFARGPDVESDDFARPDIADRLALAARSTASFPVAFEASFVRVGEAEGAEGSPDMVGQVNFSSSRFVVDGGVLDNKPLGSAIDAIFQQRIDRDTRRVLAYVVPNPGETSTRDADKFGEVPDAARIAAASLLTLPRVEPVAEEIQSIRKRNREILEARESRVGLTANLRPQQAERTVRSLAGRLFPVYQAHRTDPAISYIVSQLSDALAELDLANTPANRTNATREGRSDLWLERQSHRSWLAEAFKQFRLPWVPQVSPAGFRPGMVVPEELRVETWGWGLRLVENSMLSTLDVLRTVQRITPLGHAIRQEDGLPALWRRAFDLLRAIQSFRRSEGAYWKGHAPALRELLLSSAESASAPLEQRLRDWAKERLDAWKVDPCRSVRGAGEEVARTVATGELGHEVAALLRDVGPAARQAAEAAGSSPLAEDRRVAADLLAHVGYLVPEKSDADLVLVRLALLDVAHYALGGTSKLTDQYIELIQVSANTPSGFGGPALAHQKLAGIQLGHFGAFYKRSWRANDWMHGRLDGAANLVRAVLSPDRLRRVATGRGTGAGLAESTCAALEAIVLPGRTDPQADLVLREDWDREAVLRELAYLDRPDLPAPDALPLCSAALIRRLQLDILRTEIVSLAEAQKGDEDEWPPEGGVIGQGGLLARAVRSRLAAAPGAPASRDGAPENTMSERATLSPRNAIEIFRRYRVGTERITDDAGSDLFSFTLAHTLAVSAAIVSAPSGGLGKAKHLMRIFRGVTLIFYLLVRNVTIGSRTAAAVTATAIATGATIVLLATLAGARDMPNAILAAGWVLLLGGVLSALARRFVATALIVSLGIVAYGLRDHWLSMPPWAGAIEPLGPLVAILLVTLVLYLLGSVRRPRTSVRRMLDKLEKSLEG